MMNYEGFEIRISRDNEYQLPNDEFGSEPGRSNAKF
jgi:hypothetical protein